MLFAVWVNCSQLWASPAKEQGRAHFTPGKAEIPPGCQPRATNPGGISEPINYSQLSFRCSFWVMPGAAASPLPQLENKPHFHPKPAQPNPAGKQTPFPSQTCCSGGQTALRGKERFQHCLVWFAQFFQEQGADPAAPTPTGTGKNSFPQNITNNNSL